MIVREPQVGEGTIWDNYVRNCQFGTPQHLFAWKQVMEEAFHSRTHYLLAEENGSLQGVLPLIHVRSPLTGNYMTSLPGGICTESDEAARLLFEHARELVIKQNARYLILRDGRRKWDLPDTEVNEEHVTFLLVIPSDLEELKHRMKKRNRQVINQTHNHGMSGKFGIANLDEYYPIYSRAMRELGTPTLGLRFLKIVAARFPGELELITILHQSKIIGGGFIHPFRDTVFCLWSGLLHEEYKHHPSYLLYWKAVSYAHHNGYLLVDLGRCQKNSGGYVFKRGFGGKELQLYQQVYLNGRNKAPEVGAERKADSKYRLFTSVWRHLPLPVTEILGPLLRRQLPFG